jgi:hypothetical protein
MAITINGTTGIAGVDGSAATPAVQGADTNTGVFYPAADTVGVSTGGTERMRIDSSGNVLVGTTGNPASAKFFVAGTSAFGTAAAPEGQLTSDGTNAYLDARLTGGGLIFRTNGSSERMRIDSSGNVLVGGTSVVQNSKVLSVAPLSTKVGIVVQNSDVFSGTMYFEGFVNSAGNLAGYIAHTGTTTVSYTSVSDYRLKENVVPMSGALSKVQALKPCTYKWKSDGTSGQGFIAHELQEIIPDCVVGNKDAVDSDGNPKYQGVDTSFLVATLTAAIQEQQALITQLQADVAALKGTP